MLGFVAGVVLLAVIVAISTNAAGTCADRALDRFARCAQEAKTEIGADACRDVYNMRKQQCADNDSPSR